MNRRGFLKCALGAAALPLVARVIPRPENVFGMKNQAALSRYYTGVFGLDFKDKAVAILERFNVGPF